MLDSSWTRRFVVLTAPIAVIFALCVLAPRPASAQVEEYHGFHTTYALGVFGGYYVASDIFHDVSGDGTLRLKNSGEWGARATAFVRPSIGAELAYTRTGSDLSAEGTFNPPLPADFKPGSIHFDQIDLNLLFNHETANHKVTPYFTVGGGMSLTHPDIGPSGETKTFFALNLGAGTFIAAGPPNLGIRLDARWRSTNTDIVTKESNYTDPWGYTWNTSSDWYNTGEFTLGLSYKFQSK